MKPKYKYFRFCALAVAARLLLVALATHAQTVRVSTWNLLPNATEGTNGWTKTYRQKLAIEAAAELKKLHPDVILLQGVADWENCNQLAQALKPENYNVVLCSSFRDARTMTSSRQQVAILSRARPYISWSEAWQSGGSNAVATGGFAFAALRIGGRNTGFFSVQLGDGTATLVNAASVTEPHAREESARQLVKQIATLQGWTTNRLQAFVVAGDFNTARDEAKFAGEKTLTILEDAGLESALAGMPPEKRFAWLGNGSRPDAEMEDVFTQTAMAAQPPQISPAALPQHWGATFDLNLDAPKVAAPRQLAQAVPPPAKLNLAPSAPTVTQTNQSVRAAVANASSKRLGWLAGILTVAFALFVLWQWLSRRTRMRRIALVRINAGPRRLTPPANVERILIAPVSGSSAMDSINAPIVRIEVAGAFLPAPQAAQQPPPMGAGTAPLPESVQAGVIANLTRWMKEKLLRRLVSDRADLLATQHAATLKIMAVDERLSKIEHQIHSRNREYEDRIDELMKELAVAQEENRELIRVKIALVKAEMEKERVKAERYLNRQQQQS